MQKQADISTSQAATINVHPAFELRRSEPIESLNIVVEEYVHKKTGALHYHLNSDNTEIH